MRFHFSRLTLIKKSTISLMVFSLFLLICMLYYVANWKKDFRSGIDFIKISNIGGKTCKIPVLPLYSTELSHFFIDTPPLVCSAEEPNWIVVEGSVLKISDYIRQNNKSITCKFTDLIRVNDSYSKHGKSVVLTDSSYTLRESDVVEVHCISFSTNKKWHYILTGIREDYNIMKRSDWSKLPSDSPGLNVLMFGFDSVSRNTFIRKLPKSYKYLKEILGAHVLEGYNIVGDATIRALVPILTGKNSKELPYVYKYGNNSYYVNSYPFIWNKFKSRGYVTGYFEDMVHVGTFQMAYNGFKDSPTDHYMRSYYLASRSHWRKSSSYCYGSIPRHKIFIDHAKNFFTVYKNKPKFLFAFHGELSHGSHNMLQSADNDVYNFLRNLYEDNFLKNTVLIVMADHGSRMGEIRNTKQGHLEERLPFFSFVFPEIFKNKYKEAYANFIKNTKIITSPYDINPTLKQLLNMKTISPINIKERGMSLFSQIPENRTCDDAGIEPYWCVCLQWQKVPVDSLIIPKLTALFVNTINRYTLLQRHLCEVLVLKRVIWVDTIATFDGNLYKIKVEMHPGNSLFEAGITHYFRSNKLELNINNVSRINMYGEQARCVEKYFPFLRKYCYCKN